jgi:hypothetical protein
MGRMPDTERATRQLRGAAETMNDLDPTTAARADPDRPRRPTGASVRHGVVVRRRALVATVLVGAVVGGALAMRGADLAPGGLELAPGSPPWARTHYGNPDARGFKKRNIVEIDFLARRLFVHEDAKRHFLRLERLFEARAPEYAARVSVGTVDDWSYLNREVRGGAAKSNHSFGIAIDINALTNPLGSSGDVPEEVVRQWRLEGGAWGGDWSRPDPMHFETHLTPQEIRARYSRDGTPRDWYLEQLLEG